MEDSNKEIVEEAINEKEINLTDFLEEISGVDEKKQSKVGINFNHYIYYGKPTEEEASQENRYEEILTKSSFKPSVNFMRLGEFLIIDLIYVSSMDPEIRILFDQLELYGKNCAKYYEDEEIFPMFGLNINPYQYAQKYYIQAFAPRYWTRLPSQSLKTESNMIRILFEAKNVQLCEVEGFDDFDIKAEAGRMLEKDNYLREKRN